MHGLKSTWMECGVPDARHNTPRIGRVLIARGGDAVDTAFSTIYGNIELVSYNVWADQVDDKFTLPP